MSSLFKHLVAAHRIVSAEIIRERRRLRPDQQRLVRLKKERLAIKDRLFRHIPANEKTVRFVRSILAKLRPQHV